MKLALTKLAPSTATLALLLLLLLPAVPRPAEAGDPLPEAERETLLDSLAHGTDEQAIYATAQLFRAEEDALLIARLADRNLAVGRRLRVLKALAIHGRERSVAACRIAHSVLLDTEDAVRDQARRTILALEPLPPPRARPRESGTSYAFLRKALLALAGDEPPSERDRAEALALMEILEQKDDPILAAGILIDARKALPPSLQSRAEAALARVTGVDECADWKAWFERECRRNPRVWLMRRIRRQQRRAQTETARLEQEAVGIFRRLTDGLSGNPAALLTELRGALNRSAVVAIRRQALRLLGALARAETSVGAEALRTLTDAIARPDFDAELRLDTLKALGDTGRHEAAGPLLAILADPRPAPRELRGAVAALARLGDPDAVGPLRVVIRRELKQATPDIPLLVAAVQGLERIGRNPDGSASGVLIETVQRATAKGPPGPLTDSARAALLEAVAAAFGRLRYDSPETVRQAREALLSLRTEARPEVRFFVADSLSRLPGIEADALDALARDPELRVRRAAIAGLARAARNAAGPRTSRDDRRRNLVGRLVRIALGPDLSVRPGARDALTSLAKEDLKTRLEYLSFITEAFKARGRLDRALPFLELLDTGSGLGTERGPRMSWLLERRVEARLRLAAGRSPEERAGLLTAAEADLARLARDATVKASPAWRRLDATLRSLRGDPTAAARLVGGDLAEDASFAVWKSSLETLMERREIAKVRALRDASAGALEASGRGDFLRELDAWLLAPGPKSPAGTPIPPGETGEEKGRERRTPKPAPKGSSPDSMGDQG